MKPSVFWRLPNGQSPKRNSHDFAPKVAIELINDTCRVNPDGTITFEYHYTRQSFDIIIASCAILDHNKKEINPIDKESLVRTSIYDLLRSNQRLTSQNLLQRINRTTESSMSSNPITYNVVTGISINFTPKHSIECLSTTLSFQENRGDEFPYPRVVLRDSVGTQYENHIKRSTYKIVKMTQRAVTPGEAFYRCKRSMNITRALWNLFSNFDSIKEFYRNFHPWSLGEIAVGPIYTIHTKPGSSEEIFWYEPLYRTDHRLYTPNFDWDELEKARSSCTNELNNHPFKEDVFDILNSYAECLDQIDPGPCLMNLWSLLERMTLPQVGNGVNYDKMIARSTWGLKRRPFHKNLLNVMRINRNSYAHSATGENVTRRACMELLYLVNIHLIRIIENIFDSETLSDYARMLDLPMTIKSIEAKISRLSKVRTLLAKPDSAE